MLEFLIKNKQKIVYSILLVLLLVLIRAFENTLFYDPFITYYKGEFSHQEFPKYNFIWLFLSMSFRFYLNMMISLGLLYVIFKDSKIVKFSIFLYMVLGTILLVSFFFTLNFFGEKSTMTLFYIRRFIIHPVLILLFIPGFYYQKKVQK